MTPEDFQLLTDWPSCKVEAIGLMPFDQHGRLLMQLRDDFDFVAGGGKWSFFGGHVEPDEGLASAALREMKEETGVSLGNDQLHPAYRVYTDHTIVALQYFCKVDAVLSPEDICVMEGAGFGFLTRAQIETYDLIAPARLVCDQLIKDGLLTA